MKAARKGKRLSLERAAALASALLTPKQVFTSATVRRLEACDEVDADPVRVWALARVYGVSVEDLSPIAAEWLLGVQLRMKLTHDAAA